MVTTSWDDGHQLDLRLADLLRANGLPGTFYVAPRNREFRQHDLLTEPQVRELATEFEVGSHTITHPRLSSVPPSEAVQEIRDSKSLLEDITGKAVVSFCYPGGDYRQEHVQMVSDAGYGYARTVRRYAFDIASPYQAPTSLHAYDHYSDLWPMLRFARYQPGRFIGYRHWDRLACDMFDRVVESGGVYHLWGHSWEIDRTGSWSRLENVLGYIGGRANVTYAVNGALT